MLNRLESLYQELSKEHNQIHEGLERGHYYNRDQKKARIAQALNEAGEDEEMEEN